MNSLKVFGKYLDQPRLVSRFSRAVPPLLSLAASGIVLDSTYRAPEDKRQKVFIRNGLTMLGQSLLLFTRRKLFPKCSGLRPN